MTLDEFQQRCATTCKPNCLNLEYLIPGLCSEAGEVAGKWKKYLRDSDKTSDDAAALRRDLIKETQDTIWYANMILHVLSCTAEEGAEVLLTKLASRKERGVIEGSGDNR